jgi:hypothetical protein
MEYEDNYCRKCGAAVDVVEVELVRSSQSREVSTIRKAALPVVARGTAVIVAGTLLRILAKQLVGRQVTTRGLLPFNRAPALRTGEVEELLYYRRTRVR